ncbi:hypothetical protein E2320_010445, partial [Naja naja]
GLRPGGAADWLAGRPRIALPLGEEEEERRRRLTRRAAEAVLGHVAPAQRSSFALLQSPAAAHRPASGDAPQARLWQLCRAEAATSCVASPVLWREAQVTLLPGGDTREGFKAREGRPGTSGATFFWKAMENPEVLVGSCSTQDDENLYNVKHHSSMCQLLEDQLRRKLKFFFMNPCEKFWARGGNRGSLAYKS